MKSNVFPSPTVKHYAHGEKTGTEKEEQTNNTLRIVLYYYLLQCGPENTTILCLNSFLLV